MTPPRIRRLALIAAGTLATGGLAGAGVTGLSPGTAQASSHREAPLISGQPQYDNTDLYAFVSPDKPDTTTFIANILPFQDAAGGPNFYQFAEDAKYDIKIDTDGDAVEDVVFRWTFDNYIKNDDTFLYNTGAVNSIYDETLNFTQTYDLTLFQLEDGKVKYKEQLGDDIAVAPSNVGKASMPDYNTLRHEAIHELDNGITAFAGQADDPFFADLRVFDLLYGGDLSEVGNDTLKGYNVNSIALQVPTSYYSGGESIIGVWSTVQRKNSKGKFRQVSRLGSPLVNEVVLPLKDKDKFNASKPKDDAQFAESVTEPELPKLIEAIFKIEAPAEPRDDLVQVFLTGVPELNQPEYVTASEMLRLNLGIEPAKEPKRLGVLDGDNAGFPNGRRLTDDVIDISLQAVTGELLGAKSDLGDAVDANDLEFEHEFPYVANPVSGSDVRGAVESGSAKTQLNADAVAGESGDTVLIGSAASGVAGIVLVVAAATWWRMRTRRMRYAGR